MSTLHSELDSIDDKLHSMETEVGGLEQDSNALMKDNENAYKEIYREQILQEHDNLVSVYVVSLYEVYICVQQDTGVTIRPKTCQWISVVLIYAILPEWN